RSALRCNAPSGCALAWPAYAMDALADGPPPEEAPQPAQLVLAVMAKTTDPSVLRSLAKTLAKLAERLPPGEAAGLFPKPAQQVLDLMAVNLVPGHIQLLVETLALLAEHLPPD